MGTWPSTTKSAPTGMTSVIDIACPSCGRTESVRKYDLDEYRCEHCGTSFGADDVVP